VYEKKKAGGSTSVLGVTSKREIISFECKQLNRGKEEVAEEKM
jgi:hypothetical protein